MTVLRLWDLRKSYAHHLQGGQRTEVLRGANLTLEAGECVALTGGSGSGKSTLLRCIYRSARPDSGAARLTVGGLDLDLAVAAEREVLAARRSSLGHATQFLKVVPRVPARDLLVAEGVPAEEASASLRRLGLAPELHALPPATFSGGQRQIVNLALALARPRPLLLLDEVIASLDHERRRRSLEMLVERKRSGTAMIAVFHDVPGGLVDRVVELKEGLIVG